MDSKMLWSKLKSNVIFVTITSALGGAVLDLLQDFLTNGGNVDMSAAGLKKMCGYVLVAVVSAIVHLYRPHPSQAGTPDQTGKVLPLLLFCAVIPLAMVAGCAHKPSPLPSWAVTAPQRTVGDTISAAWQVVNGYEADLAAHKPGTDNAQLKAVMVDVQRALAVAQPAYNTWASALKQNPNEPEPANLVGAIAAIEAGLSKVPLYLK